MNKEMKLTRTLLLLALSMAAAVSVSARTNARYVFYFVGDGLGINHIVTTDLYNQKTQGRQGPTLSFLSFPVCTYVRTSSEDCLVTDSAAAATALACGVKTRNGTIGMLSDGTTIGNIMETARKRGMSTGFLTTVGISHATPAGFICHTRSREEYMLLARQLIDSGTDFLAGHSFLRGKRDTVDSRHWEMEAVRAGMLVTRNPEEAATGTDRRVILLCPDNGMASLAYAIEKKADEPSLSDYMASAVRYLETKAERNGFLLAVEGGRIDYANHDNDGATMVHEINELDKAIAMAVEFQKRHPKQTLIVVASDHETGGLGIGRSKKQIHPEYLQYQNISEEKLSDYLKKLRADRNGNITWEQMQAVLSEKLGMWSKVEISEMDTRYLREFFESNYLKGGESIRNLYSFNERLAAEAVRILNKTAIVLWTCRNHTASPTPLFVSGAGHEYFFPCRDNTDIPKAIGKAMGVKDGTR